MQDSYYIAHSIPCTAKPKFVTPHSRWQGLPVLTRYVNWFSLYHLSVVVVTFFLPSNGIGNSCDCTPSFVILQDKYALVCPQDHNLISITFSDILKTLGFSLFHGKQWATGPYTVNPQDVIVQTVSASLY